MGWVVGILIFFALPLAPTAAVASAPSPRPSFVCEDASGTAYTIVLQATRRAIRVEPRGAEPKLHRLSDPNVGLGRTGGSRTMVYDRWNPDGKDLFERLDTNVEWTTRYLIVDGHSVVRVGLWLEHREPPGLKCRSGQHGVTVEVVPATVERYLIAATDAAGDRGEDGRLSPAARLRFEAALRRFALRPPERRPAGTDRHEINTFIDELAAVVKRMDVASLDAIAARLKPEEQTIWNEARAKSAPGRR